MTTVPHSDTQSTQITITSIDMGISAIITPLHNGRYSVAIRDDDTQYILPTLYICDTIELAQAYAHTATALA